MLTPRQARYAFLPLMLLGLTALTGIAAIAIRQGLAAGSGEFWMLAWVLAFVLALPGAMVVLPIVSVVLRHATRPETVPVTGENIPATGQWSRP